MQLNTIYNVDCLSGLQQLEDNSIHCIIYSPPYWAQRSYLKEEDPNKHLELGQEKYFADYLDNLIEINKEAKRVLREDGTLFCNIGDSVTRKNQLTVKTKENIRTVCIGDFIDDLFKQKAHQISIESSGHEIIPNDCGIEILSLNDQYKTVWATPSVFIRHKTNKKIFNVKIGNRMIGITEDHSLINQNLEKAKANNIDKFLYVCDYPEFNGQNHQINIDYNLLPDSCFVSFDNISQLLKNSRTDVEIIFSTIKNIHNGKDIQKYCNTGRVSRWIKDEKIPLWAFKLLQKSKFFNNSIKNLSVSSRKGGKFPLKLSLTPEMLEFFGFWIADGSFSENCVNIAAGKDQQVLYNIFSELFKCFNVNLSLKKKGGLTINSLLFRNIMKAIGFCGYSHSKRVPSFIFGLDKNLIGRFCNGYLSGDGNISTNLAQLTTFSTINSDLRDDFNVLFKGLGYNLTYITRQNKGYKGVQKETTTSYIGQISKRDGYDFVDKYGFLVKRKIKNLQYPKNDHVAWLKRGDTKSFKATEIEEVDNYNDYVYDISVPDYERFIINDIVVHNTFYGGGKGAGGLGDTSRKQATNKGSYFGIDGVKFNNKELPKKCLCNIPSRFAIKMTDELQFVLRNEIVWHIPNKMPHPSNGRFVVDFEKVYFFVKSDKYYFNQLIEPFSKHSNPDEVYTGQATKNYEEQLAQNPSDSKRRILESMKKRGGRLKRSVWSINNRPSKSSHTATFPPDLVKNMILSGCPEGGVVLDIFAGSGTTAAVSKEHNRQYLGFELNSEFCDIANERLK